ncbi:MAG: glutamate mutase L, partial [Candidatus Cloacimonetes bacterium]|nr:glutamate mutase L [Candidatus Cloacimonadota bacterium]
MKAIKKYTLIIDIGSTTTKALLLKRDNTKYNLVGIEMSPTTVEKPFEDVKVGIKNSIKSLEVKHNISILSDNSDDLVLQEDVTFLATSSAGGGLQILVVGLTLVDSAASAMRAAYGVGGVILNTLAIDDNRTSIEKIQILNTIHPDIILFCGGVNGGALFSVFR